MKKIVVAQYWTPNISYGKYTKMINERYCEEQNYIYHLETNQTKILNRLKGRAITWFKPFFLLDILEEHNPDYVLFLDADAIVVDNSYRIEQFTQEPYDIICTEDYGDSLMNAGVILLKNTEWTKKFLQEWWDVCDVLEGGVNNMRGYYGNALWHDQTCFTHLLRTYPNCREHINVIDNRVLNGRVFNDIVNKNFIFHAFSYGLVPNRTIDTAYYRLFNIDIPSSKKLIDIVEFYGTDKHYEHNFFNLIYSELFSEIYDNVKKFMEIGVNDGNSIKLWRDYFKDAEIIGVDKNLNNSLEKMKDLDKNRMTLINYDQSKEEDLIELSDKYNNLDVVLDDGSHMMKDQQMTFGKLFKSLNPGGVYIIEDLHTSIELIQKPNHWMSWGDINKTVTLNMLNDFNETGKIVSDYMTQDEMDYLNENIESIIVYRNRPDWSVTSVIKKKK